ncbi:MAG: hypothetical protein IJI23_10115 [Lachnospiraceae bacterium]|nr:hypothetical protein [Lachnospiraceae bacterium]
MFGRISTTKSTGSYLDNIEKLKKSLNEADAVVIGAGAGLSTSAGFTYSGERFRKYFYDFEDEYGFHDMYSGGFHVMQLEPEVSWAYWARNIYINRYKDAPKPVYKRILELVKDKDYFVLTTNVDHCFQKAGIDKKRLFYTQGDYGLFQSVNHGIRKTYDNEEWVMKAMEAQGFVKDDAGDFQIPDSGILQMRIPSELIPKCPDDGSDVCMNLRADDSFVEDEGWHKAAERYESFLRTRKGKILFLELGVGYNTPVIIKYPFWQMTAKNPEAVYACVNYGEAVCPYEIKEQAICIDGDIGTVIEDLLSFFA